MTEAVGSTAAEAARALAAAQQAQAGQRGTPAGTTETAKTSRTGNEGDSVTLSQAAQELVKIRLPDGTVAEGRPLTGLKPISPESLRAEAEAGIKQMMADLGIEGDLEFSIAPRGDGSLAVTSNDPRAAEIEAAINDDAALQKTLRDSHMIAKFVFEAPAMREAFETVRSSGHNASTRALFDSVQAMRERAETSSYTFTMTGGTLTTAFVDPSGERFGGVVPEGEAA